MYKGLFRGFIPAAICGFLISKNGKLLTERPENIGFGIMLGSVLTNPLQILGVRRQVLHKTVEPTPYLQSFKEVTSGGKYIRIFTLGLIPTLIRNLLMASGLQPATNGFNQTSVAILYTLGGILLSHPFEVARVHI